MKRHKGKFLKMNGIDSMIQVQNIIDYNSSMTLFVSFYPDKLQLNHTKDSDEFTIFSIPGWDFAICYNSFSRYNFCVFDNDCVPLLIATGTSLSNLVEFESNVWCK